MSDSFLPSYLCSLTGTYEGDVIFFPAGELLLEDPSRDTTTARGGVELDWLLVFAGASRLGLESLFMRGDGSGAAAADATAVDIIRAHKNMKSENERRRQTVKVSGDLEGGAAGLKNESEYDTRSSKITRAP